MVDVTDRFGVDIALDSFPDVNMLPYSIAAIKSEIISLVLWFRFVLWFCGILLSPVM